LSTQEFFHCFPSINLRFSQGLKSYVTVSLNAIAGLNFAVNLAVIFIVSPVFGFSSFKNNE
jgi:hypothetical protein